MTSVASSPAALLAPVASRLGLAALLAAAAAAVTLDGPEPAPAQGATTLAVPAGTADLVRGPDGGLVNSIGMELRLVRGGRFRMGSDPGDPGHRANEGPAHEVVVPRDFLIASTETTVGQFRRFVTETGHVTEAERDAAGGFGMDWTTGRVVQAVGIDFRDPGFPGFVPGDAHPAVLLSWSDAEAFCRWLSDREGATYRLPTEAEWELAARGGTAGPWWFGDEPAGRANVADRSLAEAVPAMPDAEAWDDGFPFLSPVGRFPANPLGLHDVHGNVWEWCLDPHDDAAYAKRAAIAEETGGAWIDDPRTAAGSLAADEDPGFRAIRGGGWMNGADFTRAAQRVYFRPTFRYCLLSGFRVVRELEPQGD